MLNKWWNVLVVDDETDVLSVTRLALKRMTIWGAPIKLHECKSKQEAIAFMRESPEAERLALALVDVVMETDDAGLQFCDFLRNEMKNRMTRLVVRTGQAGKAPEREVVDRFDITGYLSKTEATEERLYTTVKCCIREYYPAVVSAVSQNMMQTLLACGPSIDALRKAQKSVYERFYTDSRGRRIESFEDNHAWFFGDEHVGTGALENKDDAQRARAELLANAEGKAIGTRGDRVYSTPKMTMVTLAANEAANAPEASWVASAARQSLPLALEWQHVIATAVRPMWMLATR